MKTENETTDDNRIEDKSEENKSENEIKEENNNVDLMKMKTKVNFMDDNDIEGLLLTSPCENNNLRSNIKKELLIDKDNNEENSIDKKKDKEKKDKDKESSIFINDEDKSNGINENKIIDDENNDINN